MISQAEYDRHLYWMNKAIALAKIAGKSGEIPVGAVIIDNKNQPIAQSANRKEKNHDPTAHAEILAIRAAAQHHQNWHLNNCTLYVTLEPCPMCAGAILHARLKTVVYGTDDPKTGVLRSVANFPDATFSNHRPEIIGGIASSDCRQLLQTWFMKTRQSCSNIQHKWVT
ncbi:tRNA adenosine(34) deaminase TadA [[Limnothrix rosea] IAM M-220]|uniref:tRNA adenosine(34) deaminase TadA n=1 Tax=[Limnothrix rosea] IAM M-220 TaxID=454133 RepID=UPI0009632B72|nr:tRNA adenosine(34) deaminase TadA [[Limnothrix rosea] IAM M-220]OKH19250.1 tRNA-specific adenosine deaminase [[Limnothrix rosea] IAM M-220]